MILTERRDDILRAAVEAAEGTLVPSDLPDQAGAVRDLVASMKRSPSSETRTADLVPRVVDPRARRSAVAARLYAGASRPCARRHSPACARGRRLALGTATRPRERARSPPAIRRAPPRSFSRRPGVRPRAIPRSTMRGPRRSRPAASTWPRGASTEAAKSLDPALRYRALYNLGLVGLLARPGRQHQARRAARRRGRPAAAGAAASAVVRARQVESRAHRAPAPPPPPQSGGGGGGTPPPSGAPPKPQKSEPPPSQGLSTSQAEQILNSMDRRERQTREEQQRRMQNTQSGGVKDW